MLLKNGSFESTPPCSRCGSGLCLGLDRASQEIEFREIRETGGGGCTGCLIYKKEMGYWDCFMSTDVCMYDR